MSLFSFTEGAIKQKSQLFFGKVDLDNFWFALVHLLLNGGDMLEECCSTLICFWFSMFCFYILCQIPIIDAFFLFLNQHNTIFLLLYCLVFFKIHPILTPLFWKQGNFRPCLNLKQSRLWLHLRLICSSDSADFNGSFLSTRLNAKNSGPEVNFKWKISCFFLLKVPNQKAKHCSM